MPYGPYTAAAAATGLPTWVTVGSKVLGSLGLGGGGKSSSYYANRALHQQNMQRDWLKKEMTYRVEGAKAAGIHPLYALGMSPSYSAPMITGDKRQDSLAGQAAKAIGQGIGSLHSNKLQQAERIMKNQTHIQALNESRARTSMYTSQAAENYHKMQPVPGVPGMSIPQGRLPNSNVIQGGISNPVTQNAGTPNGLPSTVAGPWWLGNTGNRMSARYYPKGTEFDSIGFNYKLNRDTVPSEDEEGRRGQIQALLNSGLPHLYSWARAQVVGTGKAYGNEFKHIGKSYKKYFTKRRSSNPYWRY